MGHAAREAIEQFSALVASRLGFRVDEHNVAHAQEILHRRLRRTGCGSVASYMERFRDPLFSREEVRQLAAELSVAETYFFRHPEQFQALLEVALPECLRARENIRKLRILSAGCACGEEAYSLAAAVRAAGCDGWDFRVQGIDANPQLLRKATEGRYSPWSLRATTEDEQRRHFHNEGREYVVKAGTRSVVTFEERNLLDDDPSFWLPGRFDIIFFRNVMIYFTPDATGQVVRRLTHSLAPGGYLFLGPAETLRGVTQEFHLRHTHGAFYYQRKLPAETAERPSAPCRERPLSRSGIRQDVPSTPRNATEGVPYRDVAEENRSSNSGAAPKEDDRSWMTSISRSAGRIAALAEQCRRQPSKAHSAAGDVSVGRPCAAAVPGHPLEPVRHLLRRERFEDALRQLGALPTDLESDPDALLLRAVLLVNTGEVAKAGEVCQRLLAVDELDAGAHYLMAVCREHSGDCLAAAEHDQQAIYLDPEFAMPRMHLGLLAKRLGDLSTARRELTEAVGRLAREDSSHILLFGGGFSREALIQYCHSQLRNCGGES
jgi:chemotaxis protein methyltransferase CheR